MTRTRAGQAGLVLDAAVELASRLPERGNRCSSTREIPDARGDDAVGARHPSHLGDSRNRIRHEVHDQLRERRVERAVGIGQVFGARKPHVHTGVPRPCRGNERLGRIDGCHGVGTKPPHEFRRQRAGAAPDVEHSLADVDAPELCELRRELRRVPPHEAVIRVGSDGEAHARTLSDVAAALRGLPLEVQPHVLQRDVPEDAVHDDVPSPVSGCEAESNRRRVGQQRPLNGSSAAR